MKPLFLVVVVVLGCSKKQDEAKTAPPGSAAPAATVVAVDAAVAVPADFVPAKLAEKEGVIFAETKGGQVQGIPDGTRVTLAAEKEVGAGEAEEATVTVNHGGKGLDLAADRVLREGGELHRSPNNKFAVWSPMVSCGDLCHTVVWVIGVADGRRTKLGDAGVDIHVAWHPDGKTVAVGAGSLWTVSLADFAVKTIEDYLSPSFSPDGTLYVRDGDGSAFKVEGDKPVRVWKAKKRKEATSEEDLQPAPAPVKFVDGKPKFALE